MASAKTTQKKTKAAGGEQEPAAESTPAPIPEQAPGQVAEQASAPEAEQALEPPAEDDGLRDEVLKVLRMRNTHRPSQSLIEFQMRENRRRRFVLVDIDGDTMTAAWERYRSVRGAEDMEGFVILVHDILEKDLPRIFSRVDFVKLERGAPAQTP